MGWHRSIRWLRRASWVLVLPGLLGLSSFRALADDDDGEVIKRLTKYGKLSGGEAKRLERTVSGRLKRAADITNNGDPLRMAVSNALYGTPVPADAMASAKVRLRLYAGLNDWALDQLFSPRPGAVASCTSSYGVSKSDCEALLAAGGRVSLGDAARLGAGTPVGGPAVAPAPQYGARPAYGQPAYGQPAYAQPRYGQAPAYGAQPSRFGGSYNSGYQQRPVQNYAPPPAAAPGYAPGYAAQRPVAAARPAPMPPPQPMVPQQSAAQRKAEYARQRQAYLERKKQEMEARKAKVVQTAGGTERVQRGPTSAEEAAVAGLDPADVPANKPAAAQAKGAPAGKPAKGAAPAPSEPVASAPEESKPAGPEKAPALETDFLDSLMDDPLGKSK
jgi:hypothetical protein